MIYDDLEKYLKKNASTKSYARGKEMSRQNRIADFSINDDDATYLINGETGRYTVKISWKNRIKSSCDCPYDFGGICKHEVVSLLDLMKKTKSNPKLKSVKIKVRTADVAFLISKVEAIDNEYLTTIYSTQNFYYFQPFTLLTTFESGYIEFRVKGNSYYDKIESIVKFSYNGNDIETTCSCAQKTSVLCPHQTIIAKNIVTSKANFLPLLIPAEFEKYKKTILEDYGFEDITDFKSYFRFNYESDKITLEKTNISDGLFAASRLQTLGFSKLLTEIPANLDNMVTKINADLHVGYVFIDSKKTTRYIAFRVISGKMNKDKSKLVSRINEIIDYRSYNSFIYDEFDEIIFSLFYKFKSNYEYHKPTPELLFDFYAQVFEHLIGKPYIYKSENNLSVQSYTPIQVSLEKPILQFELSENKQFFLLTPYLLLGEIRYYSPINLFSDFFIEIENTIYQLSKYTDCKIIDHFENKAIKVAHNNFPVLFNDIIEPLSKDYHIDMKKVKTIPKKTFSHNPIKRRLYISEMDKYVLFKPAVLYDNDVEIIAFQENDVVKLQNDHINIYKVDNQYHRNFVNLLREQHQSFRKQLRSDFFHLTVDEFSDNFWFFDVFETLKQNDVEIFGLEVLKQIKYSPHKAVVAISIKSGQDWFDVEIDISFGDEKLSLKDIQKAIVNHERFVKLNNGQLGVLPQEWYEKFERYFRQGEIKKNQIKISSFRFNIIDELFAQHLNSKTLNDLYEKRKKLQEFTEIKEITVPEEIKATLRDYQKTGVSWLNFLDEFKWGGILADDMGLGKTLQIITFLQTKVKKQKAPNLIIVPATLIFNWRIEIEKFAPELKVLYHHGVARVGDLTEFTNYQIVITSYGMVYSDVEKFKDFKFNYIILDESQAIKNPMSKRYKAVCLLEGANRLALTGTPIENNTFDLFAQMSFLNPGFLGSQTSFKENYSNPIDKEANVDRAKELQRLIHPFILRRTKEQVAKELPPKIEDYLFCEMGDEQQKVYNAFRDKYRDYLLNKFVEDGFEKSKLYVLEGLLKLRQICDSPAILNENEDYGSESAKVDELMHHISEKTAHHKLLIFSQFVKMLKIIERKLNENEVSYEYLDGQSSQKEREQSVNHFQTDEECRVFLISLKAGGFGLNLTKADYVYVVDPWWNPAVENQAIDRCYRIGQDKTVIAYRMICKDTVEEKIINLQNKKRQIASDIISTDENVMKQLSQQDILDLFK